MIIVKLTIRSESNKDWFITSTLSIDSTIWAHYNYENCTDAEHDVAYNKLLAIIERSFILPDDYYIDVIKEV